MKAGKPIKTSADGTGSRRPTVTALPLDNVNPADIAVQPPKTPAIADLISPSSSTSLMAAVDSRDTPPPSHLSVADSQSNATEGAGRTARRARSQVNYAEPSLISKMRRPNKDLADAVVPGEKDQRSTDGAGNTGGHSEQGKPRMRTVVVKRQETDVDWKQLPVAADASAQSPLHEKGSHHQQTTENLDSKAIMNGTSKIGGGRSGDATTTAIAATSRRKKDKGGIDTRPVEDAVEKLESLTIYDFNESSPGEATRDTEAQGEEDTGSNPSQRHSSANAVPTRMGTNKRMISKERTTDTAQESKNSARQATTRTTSFQSARGDRSGQLQESSENAARLEGGRTVRAARRRSMML